MVEPQPGSQSAGDVIRGALEEYKRSSNAAFVQESEAERKEMLERFPLERWPEMKLEEYALGQPDSSDTYCRWVEFNTPHLGSIRGGSARKLIVYKHGTKPGWYYDESSHGNEQEAWEAVRAAFVDALRAAGEGKWADIDELVALRSGPALLLKTLHIYLPDGVLPICSQEHLRRFLTWLRRGEAADYSIGPVALNRTLLAVLRDVHELEGWSTNELERFLYSSHNPAPATRMVKIAPGH